MRGAPRCWTRSTPTTASTSTRSARASVPPACGGSSTTRSCAAWTTTRARSSSSPPTRSARRAASAAAGATTGWSSCSAAPDARDGLGRRRRADADGRRGAQPDGRRLRPVRRVGATRAVEAFALAHEARAAGPGRAAGARRALAQGPAQAGRPRRAPATLPSWPPTRHACATWTPGSRRACERGGGRRPRIKGRHLR